jgi:hypothetical protein
MNFNIDINNWVNTMLPSVLRKPVAKAFLKVLVSPILAYYAISGTYYQLKLNEIQPNLLTDVLQALLRTIYPNTVGTNFKCWIYNQYELTPQTYLQFIGGHMLQENDYSIGETFTQEYDYFIAEQIPAYDYAVVIPVVYNTPANMAAMEALLKKYKPAGKRISITFQNIV